MWRQQEGSESLEMPRLHRTPIQSQRHLSECHPSEQHSRDKRNHPWIQNKVMMITTAKFATPFNV